MLKMHSKIRVPFNILMEIYKHTKCVMSILKVMYFLQLVFKYFKHRVNVVFFQLYQRVE